jgi:lipopolysaccharide/colanic/teichoic acid biosynthesis glycosyltransferase
MLYLFSKNSNLLIKKLFRVIKGELSIVGLQSIDGSKASICKEGLISLAGLNPESKNNPKLVEKLNLFYIENYSFFLDLDILFNHLTGRKSGI